MAKRGWVAMDGIPERAEEVMSPFVEAAGGLDTVDTPLLRQGIAGRLNTKADGYAVLAWCMRISSLALENPLETPFRKKNLTLSALKDIARLSYFEDGPLLAREYLAKQGIHVIVVPHLAKTYLDGGAMLLPDGNAIIGLTLRYDRLDNFWFTLLHELAHLARHLSDECRLIVDDLDLRSHDKDSHDRIENEADELASTALVPRRYWPILDAGEAPKAADVLSLAKKLKVHPSPIAGRIRFKHNNYRMLSKLVGRDQVRKFFSEYEERTTS